MLSLVSARVMRSLLLTCLVLVAFVSIAESVGRHKRRQVAHDDNRSSNGTSANESPPHCWRREFPQDAAPRHRKSDHPPKCCNVEGQKFYMYEFEAERLCHSGAELLDLVKATPSELRQSLAPGIFMRQRLADHPWRTMDPSQATLFVVPSILDIASMEKPPGCKVKLQRVLHAMITELEASEYYQRNQGRDHLVIALGWRSKSTMRRGNFILSYQIENKEAMNSTHGNTLRTFQHLIRNMILGMKPRPGGLSHSREYKLSFELSPERTVVIPHMAPSALTKCTFNTAQNKVVCKDWYTGEETFEDYRASRNHTLNFIGNGHRHETPGQFRGAGMHLSKAVLRQLAIYKLGEVRPPNVLAETGEKRTGHGKIPCDFENGVIAGCHAGRGFPADVAQALMHQSLLSLHIRGDDMGSSRVYEAIASGTPQLFLAARFYHDIASFRCAVPWSRVFKHIPEVAFEKDPAGAVEGVLNELLDEPEALSPTGKLGQMWAAQREAARHLLWHHPESLVGHNIVEDAIRIVMADVESQKLMSQELL